MNYILNKLSHLQKRLEDYVNDKNCFKIEDHCHYKGKYRGVAHGKWILKYITPKEMLVVFHNGLNYDYHAIIKMHSKEFEGQLICI